MADWRQAVASLNLGSGKVLDLHDICFHTTAKFQSHFKIIHSFATLLVKIHNIKGRFPYTALLLLHHCVHCTHVSLRILEFLNQTMVALVVFLTNHLSVRFLDFLHSPQNPSHLS